MTKIKLLDTVEDTNVVTGDEAKILLQVAGAKITQESRDKLDNLISCTITVRMNKNGTYVVPLRIAQQLVAQKQAEIVD